MATWSRVLRWVGALFVVVGAVQALAKVGDDCGSVIHPNSMRSPLLCSGPLADQQQTVLLLVVLGVASMLAGQIINWQQRKA